MHPFLDLDIDLESKVIMVSSNDRYRRKYDAASNLIIYRENVEQIIYVDTDDNNGIEYCNENCNIYIHYKFYVLLNSLLFILRFSNIHYFFSPSIFLFYSNIIYIFLIAITNLIYIDNNQLLLLFEIFEFFFYK